MRTNYTKSLHGAAFEVCLIVLLVSLAGTAWPQGLVKAPPPGQLEEDFDFKPPQRNVGERLFLDTRFSQFFFANSHGDANARLASGDPALAKVHTATSEVPGPFASGAINCRACHYVDDLAKDTGGSNRTYSDFESHSRIPSRFGDQRTARNSIGFVNAFAGPPDSLLLHADGEFNSVRDLVEATMTGKNFGWKPEEHDTAVAHIAHIIRDDDGTDPLSKIYGGSYRKVLLGTSFSLRAGVHLPNDFRLDVSKATDREIMDLVTRLIESYLVDLKFSRSYDTFYDGSPYDVFLRMNALPMGPKKGEAAIAYADRLAEAVNGLQSPKFVREGQFDFRLHKQPFVFGELELHGLKIFLARATPSLPAVRTASVAAASNQTPSSLPLHSLPLVLGAALFGGVFWLPDRKHRAAALMICALLVITSGVTIPQVEAAEPAGRAANGEAHVGNCVACHTPPDFTDFRFHNNGATQEEYDALHGAGSFARMFIPSFEQREKKPAEYLPSTPQHPGYKETMRAEPLKADARLVDLGMWNIYANPDYPAPQAKMTKLLCAEDPCSPAEALPKTIALFKTPTLRDLADSQPYMHTGRIGDIDHVLTFYRQMSALARAGKVRNADPQLAGISIDADDAKALAAFLRSLTEDYEHPLPEWMR